MPEITALTSRAAVVAVDCGVRMSLVLLLEILGLDVRGFAEPGKWLEQSQLKEEVAFIDCIISERRGFAEVTALRALGWQGTAVFMTETEWLLPQKWPEGQLRILVKPFSSDDVVHILDHLITWEP
jgi:FixJ family two-component response regulator